SALANSRGLFAAYRETHSEFSITMQEGSAAGWAKANSADVRAFDPQKLAARAGEKAHLAVNARELAPGRYTVILEPAAVLDLVGFLFYDFSATARGLLVARPWYIREVDPYEKVMTGMPRDGLFLVENGHVTGGVRNFRFNQSLIEMLKNAELLGPAVRATGEEAFEMVVPAMK